MVKKWNWNLILNLDIGRATKEFNLYINVANANVRGWNTSINSACSDRNQNLCTVPKQLKCVFKVKRQNIMNCI